MRSYDFFANVNLFFLNIPTHIPPLEPSMEGLSSTYYTNKCPLTTRKTLN